MRKCRILQFIDTNSGRMKGEMSMDELLYFVNSIHDNLME